MAKLPKLSVVILTLNEEENILGCLTALAGQHADDFEVIVIDAASTDRTCDIVTGLEPDFPVPLHLEAVPYLIPIGAARNLGVQLARAEHVAYLSADAEPDPDWVDRAIAGLTHHAMVFGRQLHAPRRWTAFAAARGLRYQFPDGHIDNPLPFASNVAAAYRKDVLEAFPFADDANAAEDLLLARRASTAGNTAVYDPRMVVYHHDVTTAREELRKNTREGYAWAVHRGELGTAREVLLWGATLILCAAVSVNRPAVALALPPLLWMPAARRTWRRRNAMTRSHRLAGFLVSPFFDLAFLAHYLRGLTRPTSTHRTTEPTP